MLRKLLAKFAGLLSAALVAGVVVMLVGWAFAGAGRTLPAADPQAAAREAARRDVGFDESDLFSLVVEDANVTPTGQSPLLDPLVENGALPPVIDRLPREPLVLRGVDGPGEYGGTWMRVAPDVGDAASVASWRMAYAAPVRWSPLGDPVVPHIAKSLKTHDGGRTWTFTLRDGHRWSDGAPLTSDDVIYWWQNETLDPTLGSQEPPWWLLNGAEVPTFTKVSDTVFTVGYDSPNGLFRELMASFGHAMFNSPRHFLETYHPTLGDSEFIGREMAAYALVSPRALYAHVQNVSNPQHPRLWPWIVQDYRNNPPSVFVRNPYYFAVDERGRQLPYVDRVQYDVRRVDLIPLDVAAGRVSMQTRNLRFIDYSEYMSRRESAGIEVLSWYNASRSDFLIYPNLNRRAEADDPSSEWKVKLLNERDFRRALSLALDRREIIEAEYLGLTEPMQIAPGRGSPYHDEELATLNVEHDPQKAEQLLDGLGLTRPRPGAFRTFPDGSEMVWFLDYTAFTGRGPVDFIVDQWAKVGVRVIGRERARSLWNLDLRGRTIDFTVWTGESDFAPLISPRNFVPHTNQSFYAPGWGNWFAGGGFNGREIPSRQAFAPPEGSRAMRAMALYDEARRTVDEAERVRLFKKLWKIAADEVWTINVGTPPPTLVVRDADMGNVPEKALAGYVYSTPGNCGIETYYFKTKRDSPGAVAQARAALADRGELPRPGAAAVPTDGEGGFDGGRLIGWLVTLAAVLGVLMLGLRHPFVGRRLLIMVPTLLILSVLVFAVIQAPPGDYLTARIAQLEEAGDTSALREIDDLREIFHFDDPAWKQYLRWMGVFWFTSFDQADKGLLQGDLGRSMTSGQSVNLIVGDRLLLTMLISAGTILFTWVVAMPIGVYSAVRQYSAGDYAATLVGFVGMAVPNFLLALVLMAVVGVSGLFSTEYAAQPEWTWGKVVDLLKHLWIPILVLGTGGTAGMIRVMRANLLDELNKPYVTTARAKGVRPLKLLAKYPVRLALNPFVSGIGGILPALVSGGAIVAIVLSLPTVGPLLLEALFLEDMYMAGSMLMVLSLLGVVGTLLSDLLLLWIDPRIRMEGGGR